MPRSLFGIAGGQEVDRNFSQRATCLKIHYTIAINSQLTYIKTGCKVSISTKPVTTK